MHARRLAVPLLLACAAAAPPATGAEVTPPVEARVSAIQNALVEAGLDGWLLFDFRGSNPLAYRVLGLDAESEITTRRWYYWIPAKGEPQRLVHAIEEGRLDRLPGGKHVYLSWQRRLELLAKLASGAKRVAMEFSPMNDIPTLARVDAGTVDYLRSLGLEVVSSGDLVGRFESTWSDAQLASHRRVAGLLHGYVKDAFARVGSRLAAGEPVSEREVQAYLVERMAADGLVEEPPIVAVNANAANPHYLPGEGKSSPIRRGDLLLIDIYTKAKRTPGAGDPPVCADITWMAFCGAPSELPAEMARVFAVVRDARDAAVRFVRDAFASGKPPTGAEVDDVARGVVREAGFGDRFLHRTGHSIGEEVHGNGTNIDNLETRDTRRILRRTCFSIEPGIYLEGRFGVRSEVDVWVGEDGVEVTGPGAQTELVFLLDEPEAPAPQGDRRER